VCVYLFERQNRLEKKININLCFLLLLFFCVRFRWEYLSTWCLVLFFSSFYQNNFYVFLVLLFITSVLRDIYIYIILEDVMMKIINENIGWTWELWLIWHTSEWKKSDIFLSVSLLNRFNQQQIHSIIVTFDYHVTTINICPHTFCSQKYRVASYFAHGRNVNWHTCIKYSIYMVKRKISWNFWSLYLMPKLFIMNVVQK
jgi:hypothetical protein